MKKSTLALAVTVGVLAQQASAAQGTDVAIRSSGSDRYQFDKGAHLRLMKDLAQWTREGLVVHEDSTRSGQQAL
ncbi:extracellular solute-binding protein, partial [Pseudomonas syringae pv. japonica str. M301072]